MLTPDGRVRGTGEEETLDVGLVVRAVGYTAEPIPGLPFDEATGTVPNVAGRVIGADGAPVAGAVRHRLDPARPDRRDRDQQARRRRGRRLGAGRPAHAAAAGSTGSGRPAPVLAEHDVRPVDWTAWLRLDAEEIRLGQARGAERVKVAELQDMLAAVHGVPPRPSRGGELRPPSGGR